MTTTNTLRIEKRTFCGIELDIILGHPEHEMLFFAKQALEAAGLKLTVGKSVSYYIKAGVLGSYMKIKDLPHTREDYSRLHDVCQGNKWWNVKEVWLATEEGLYDTLLRGRSPNTEPFRKWVKSEVLPTIRKTGSYNITESETPEAKQFAEQNADVTALVGLVKVLVEQNAEMMKMLIAGREGVTPPAKEPTSDYRTLGDWLAHTVDLPRAWKSDVHTRSLGVAMSTLSAAMGYKVHRGMGSNLYHINVLQKALARVSIPTEIAGNANSVLGHLEERCNVIAQRERTVRAAKTTV